MARIVNLTTGWLARQLDSAEERASQYPTWLTSPQSRSRGYTGVAETGQIKNEKSSSEVEES